MFKLSLKNLWARKGRLALTALAVIAGTAFLSGVFVFTDTVKASFDKMFVSAYAHTDAVVRSAQVLKGEFGDDSRNRIPDSLIATIGAVPHVAETSGQVQGLAVITIGDKIVGQDGPPKFGGTWTDSTASPFRLVEGAPPTDREVVVDLGSAKSGPIAVGDTITVLSATGQRHFRVSGIASFGGTDSALGTTWCLFTLPTAQAVLSGEPGKVNYVAVRGDGTLTQTELAAQIATALPQGLEVRTGAQMTKESQDSVAKILNVITIAFSVFALISLFVGSFIIYNVFSISAAQRTQENALLRAIGASRAQVTRSMFGEALTVGAVGSVIGCVAGLGLAAGILELMQRLDRLPSSTTLEVRPQGFVITIIVGVLVTLVCAVAPALRSGRVPPLAAMRDVAVDRSDVSRVRVALGVLALVAAAVATYLGITVKGQAEWLGVAAAALFSAVIILGPLFAGPFARAMSPVLGRIRPVAGTIAGRNAARNPKRTALTAGALAIVVALFIGVATLGASAKESVHRTLRSSIVSDYVVTAKIETGIPYLPPEIADQLNRIPGVVAMGVSTVGLKIEIDGKLQDRQRIAVTRGELAAKVLTVPFTAGGFAGLNAGTVLVSDEEATERGWALGTPLTVQLTDGTTKVLTVAGIYTLRGFGRMMVDRSLFDGHGTPPADFSVFAKTDGSTAARDAVKATVANYQAARLQDYSAYLEAQSNQIDSFLNLIYGLLGMSLFIAVVGIVITLLLAVYERRRELGLVRAVGMSRRQVRSSVTWEALLTSFLGAALGLVLGIALGWIIVKALSDEGLNVFALPTWTIAIAVLGAIVLALVAAFVPARKAANADILDAIATT